MKGNFSSVWALLLTALCSCSSPRKDHPALVRFEYHRPEMGVRFRLVFYADNQAKADAGAEAAYGRIQQLNDILTDYDPESELSRLSRTSGQGREVPLSRDLWFVLKRAQALAERSDGAFDVTVGPYVILWRQARRQHKLPEAARLEQARKSVGYKLVRLNPKWRSAELLAPDMRLDLGGIAKGYAVDEAQKVLRRLGIHQALVEGGGDLAVPIRRPEKRAGELRFHRSMSPTRRPGDSHC